MSFDTLSFTDSGYAEYCIERIFTLNIDSKEFITETINKTKTGNDIKCR